MSEDVAETQQGTFAGNAAAVQRLARSDKDMGARVAKAAVLSTATVILGILGIAMPGAQPVLALIPIMAIAAASVHALVVILRAILMGAVARNLAVGHDAVELSKFYRAERWGMSTPAG